MNERPRPQHEPYQWALIVLLLLVAFWFRTTRLADVPPGLHHDDIKNVLLVEKILDGYWRIYYPENFGHEPLYHWLQAIYFGLVGSGYPELRLLSVGISIFGLAAIYVLVRRLLGVEAALWTLAWQAVSLWPLFYSRRAIRGILLPPLAALAGYFFMRGLAESPLSPPRTNHGGEEERNALGGRHLSVRAKACEGVTPEPGARTKPPLCLSRKRYGGEEESRVRAGVRLFSLSRGLYGGGLGWGHWALGGAALAGCLYTYAGSRVLPFFFLLFVGYLALFQHKTLRARWRGVLLFFVVTALLAAPLVVYLVANPEERMGQINEPLTRLLAGDLRPLLKNSLRVFGMFTFIGDPYWRQYVADTPVFEPLGALLFYGGLLLALWRWRRPAYAFLLLWLPVALLPGMLSEGAPNFLRPIAALTVVYVFPALAIRELLAWLGRAVARMAQSRAVLGAVVTRAVTLALLIGVLGLNAWRTYGGYVVRWPHHPDARFAYSSTLLDVSRYLDRSPEIEHALLSGHFASDLDPEMVARFLRRRDLETRWADVRQALVYAAPGGAEAGASADKPTYLVQPDYFPIDPVLQELFVEGAPIHEQTTAEGTFVFAVYRLRVAPLAERLAAARGSPVGWSGATVFPDGLPDDWQEIEEPVLFAGRVSLLGYQVLNETSAPGDVITVLTYWRAERAGPAAGITFLHLLGPDGAVVAGYDGFGAPPNRWQTRDTIVQMHRFALPGDLAPGAYPIELGWYERDSGVRWRLELSGDEQVDRLLLRPLNIAAKDP